MLLQGIDDFSMQMVASLGEYQRPLEQGPWILGAVNV